MPTDPAQRRKLAAIHGAVSAILLAFPAAAIVALVYRFPIPFADKVSGVEAVPGALMAVMIYGCLMLGFLPLAAMGAACGVTLSRVWRDLPFPDLRLRISAILFGLDLLVAVWLGDIPF